ncbi:MAG: phosphoribosylformimino-5-aminoimidazole carboxamide ribotide isomerase [Ruminococcaceae bacterium]|nr:phosphoribosylformimino-5-aminoimidazole carboxamide ribotide isomerase [Oscillospiraceae bacterium]
MKFRPCIDIHNGKVKQIVGGTLSDDGVKENFVSSKDSSYYAELFKKDKLTGGHIIMLDRSPETKEAALSALKAYPSGMQIGGGINDTNCLEYLEAGASHIIVTSYIFSDGKINQENLNKLCSLCGKGRIVLDLSCKGTPDGKYIIATDRWQKLTDTELTPAVLEELSSKCGEFLVHAVNAEGLKAGIDPTLVKLLSHSPLPVTYAGGIGKMSDISEIETLGKGKVDFTVGSALDLFGGYLPYEEFLEFCL